MNRLIVIVAIAFCHQTTTAQTWNEWFRQKKTQKKYLIQQIAALKVYLGYLKEGYDIAQKGLTIVGDIKEGKFDLDLEYLESLRNANSQISGSTKVASIVAYQRMIIMQFRRLLERSNGSDFLTQEEKDYTASVYTNILRESESTIEVLDRVLGNSDLEMKDDERLERLDLLYADMKDQYVFTRAFANSTGLLISQRSKEYSEIDVQEKLIQDL